MLRLKTKDPNYILILSQETTNFLILYFSNKFSKKLIEEELQFIVNSGIFRIVKEREEIGSLSSQSSQLMKITPSVFWLEKEVGYKNGCFWEKFAPLREDKKGVICKMEKKKEIEMNNRIALSFMKTKRDISWFDPFELKAYDFAIKALENEIERQNWIEACETLLKRSIEDTKEFKEKIKILKGIGVRHEDRK